MRPATLRAAGADGAGFLSDRAASVAAAGRGREPSGASGGARRAVQDAKGGDAGEHRRRRPACRARRAKVASNDLKQPEGR